MWLRCKAAGCLWLRKLVCQKEVQETSESDEVLMSFPVPALT